MKEGVSRAGRVWALTLVLITLSLPATFAGGPATAVSSQVGPEARTVPAVTDDGSSSRAVGVEASPSSFTSVPPFIDGIDGIQTNGTPWDPDPALWPHSAPIMVRGSQYGATEAKVKLRMQGNGDPVSKRVPQQTCLVTDDSGSMSWNDPNNMRVAAMQLYIDQLTAPDEICVVAYSDTLPSGNQAEVRVALTSNYADAKAGIGQFVSNGGTPIAPALQVANDEIIPKNKTNFAWAEILMTDGCYNSGGDPQPEVDRAALNRIRIFAIGLYPDPNSADKQMCEPMLIQWAQVTGGKYYWVQNPSDLSQVYQDIAGYLSTLAGTSPKSGAPMVSLKLTADIEVLNGSFRCDPGLCVEPRPNNGTPIPDGNLGMRLDWYEPTGTMATGQSWQVEFAVRSYREALRVKVNDISRSFISYDRYDQLPAADVLEQMYVDVTVPVPPKVVWTSPADGFPSTPLDWPVEVRFDQSMEPSKTSTAIHVQPPVAGTSVLVSGDVLKLFHISPFAAGTRYDVNISTNATSEVGVPMAARYAFSFNTSAVPTPPRVVATDPASAAVGVPLDKTVTVLFDQAMDPVSTKVALTPSRPFPAGSSVTVNGRELRWTHTEPFEPDTGYLITILRSAESVGGIAMGQDYQFLFNTGLPPVVPRIVATVPRDSATDVSLNQWISFTFDIEMDPTSVWSAFSIAPGPVPGTMDSSGTFFGLRPSSPLLEDTTYSVVITGDALSLAGVRMEDPYVFMFRTLKRPINPAPEVTMVPEDRSTNVTRGTTIVLAFTTWMDTRQTESAVSIAPPVSVTKKWDVSGRVLSLQPAKPLNASTRYVVAVSTDAVSSKGVPLRRDFTSMFTTAATDGPGPGPGPERAGLIETGTLPWAGLLVLALIAALVTMILLARWKRRRDDREELARMRRTGGRGPASGPLRGRRAAEPDGSSESAGVRADRPRRDREAFSGGSGSVIAGARDVVSSRRAAARRGSAAQRIARLRTRSAERP